MINYIYADIKRIAKRLPRIIALIIVYAILLTVIAVTRSSNWNSVMFINAVEQYSLILPLVIGLVEIAAVYSDDFKAKAMQIAIGTGMPRRRVVLSKYLEIILLVLADVLICALLAFAAGAVLGADIDADQASELAMRFLGVWLNIISYLSLTMILMFYMQGTGGGTILYLVLSLHIINNLIGLVAGIKAIQFLHIDSYTLTSMLQAFTTRLYIGTFSAGRFAGIILYIVAGYTASAFVFSRRELDF